MTIDHQPTIQPSEISRQLSNNAPPALADFDTRHIKKDQPPFVLVDGSYYLFRCFYGMPPLSNAQGLPTNAVRGVLNALNKLLRTYHPTHMAIAFDTKAPTFRHELSAHYKATRKPIDPDLLVQIPYVQRLIRALGMALVTHDGYEADDIIGTLAYQACQRGQHVVISTGDKDMAQLVNDAVILDDSFQSSNTDTQGVLAKFGVLPNQIIDYLTLMGDASDGIMGIPKIGKKTAQKLLQEYQTIDAIIAHATDIKGAIGQSILAHQDNIAVDKLLATIVTNLPLNFVWEDFRLYRNANDNDLQALYAELNFKKELMQLNQHPPTTQDNTDQDHNDKSSNAINCPAAAPTKQPLAYQSISDKDQLARLLDELSNLPHFAIHCHGTTNHWQQATLTGISISPQLGRAFYIPLLHKNDLGMPNLAGHHLHAQNLNTQDVLGALKPLLESPRIGKIAYDIKQQNRFFAQHNISAANWQMDTMLASYVIHTTAIDHADIAELAAFYLNRSIAALTDIVGKGKKQVGFDTIAINVASDYACAIADNILHLFTHFKNIFTSDSIAQKLLHNLEMPTALLLGNMEQIGILVDRKLLMQLSLRFEQEIQMLEKTAFALAGEMFNLASPKQLGAILFDKLGIKGGKKTKTGQYSTNESTLQKINHPLADVVLAHRELTKLKNTYTDALDKVADHCGRVHTHYHQALTSTGRLSSANPNLQNIPIRTDNGRIIRQAFIAPKGRILVAADYSQIELRLMAHFSQDPGLLAAFRQNSDIHRKTASEILGKDIADIVPHERRQAKAVNFGLLYGMSAFGLARQLKIDTQEAKGYIQRYFASYPGVYEYMERTKAQAKNQGYVETILGRKLFMPELSSSNRIAADAALRAAINAPLQGSAADIIKLAMIAAMQILPHAHAQLLLQVHDELVFEVDTQHAQDIGEQIKSTMENVITTTAQALGFNVTLSVPLMVDIGYGENWERAH